MNQYMTALLLICATLMGQGQPAQLNVRVMDSRGRQELSQASVTQPLLRAQLGMLASVDLQVLFTQHDGGLLPPVASGQEQTGLLRYVNPGLKRPVTLLALASPSTRAP